MLITPKIKPRLMAVINVTPNSYFPASRVSSLEQAVAKGELFYKQGADILDIGGESTNPGADPVDEAEEIRRVVPVISALRHLPIPLSIDTQKPRVAEAALAAGATFISDITGFRDPYMRKLAAASNAEACVMHMQGNPKTMQIDPSYPEGVINHLLAFFKERIELLLKDGVDEKKIILDPGIGFGKTVAHNLQILHNLPKIVDLGLPVLIGLSRKAFIRKIVGKPVEEVLAPTIAANTVALQGGASIIRVHDVVEHRDVIDFLTSQGRDC